MSKFKIKMKLSGFELEIEGSKEDIPNIQHALSQQLGGLLQPGAGFIEESQAPEMKTITPEIADAPVRTIRSRKRGATAKLQKSSESQGTGSLDGWPADVTKYCAPAQTWNTREKGMWLLYVAKKEAIASEISASQIRDTFNHHYKQSKPISLGNLNRDFGTAKGTYLAEDVSKRPSCWFLTDLGVAAVEKRIVELKDNQGK